MKIVIDKELIDNYIQYLEEEESESISTAEKVGLQFALLNFRDMIKDAQPLEEVVKPLLEDAYEHGGFGYSKSCPDTFSEYKKKYVSQILENLNK
jgi:hypothetical protein